MGSRGVPRKMGNQKVSEVTCQSISPLPRRRKMDGERREEEMDSLDLINSSLEFVY